jgi:hypothetical protein
MEERKHTNLALGVYCRMKYILSKFHLLQPNRLTQWGRGREVGIEDTGRQAIYPPNFHFIDSGPPLINMTIDSWHKISSCTPAAFIQNYKILSGRIL